jgi:hypothetical protein
VYVADQSSNNRVQVFAYSEETTDISSNITLTSPWDTTISCSGTSSESELDSQDASYSYPLGLVNFCMMVEAGSTHEVTVTFKTERAADEVVARKYNSNTNEYSTISGATISETTLDSSPALQLTYNLTDGGSHDEDGEANGTILDPVGLGVEADSGRAPGSGSESDNDGSDMLADTGNSQVIALIVASALLSTGIFGGAYVLRKPRRMLN